MLEGLASEGKDRPTFTLPPAEKSERAKVKCSNFAPTSFRGLRAFSEAIYYGVHFPEARYHIAAPLTFLSARSLYAPCTDCESC